MTFYISFNAEKNSKNSGTGIEYSVTIFVLVLAKRLFFWPLLGLMFKLIIFNVKDKIMGSKSNEE